jgi:hypothetical protein
MSLQAAGIFRRTPLERSSQQVSWDRADQAFFAAGACHVLAWTCRATYADQPIGLCGLRFAGEPHVFHVYATWAEWAFDHSGWHLERDLLAANRAFEGRSIEQVPVGPDLTTFCDQHYSRMPAQYWQDPVPRARLYLDRFAPPWVVG